MVFRRFGLQILLFLGASIAAAQAKVCTPPEIDGADSKLPSVIVVKPGQSSKQAINSILNCEFPFSKNNQSSEKAEAVQIIGRKVVDTQNNQLGTISDILINKKHKAKFAIVDTTGYLGFGNHKVIIATDYLRMKADMAYAPFTSGRDFASLPAYTEGPEPVFMHGFGVIVQGFGKNLYSFKGSIGNFLSDLWKHGLDPLRRISLLIQSVPVGARIVFQNTTFGATEVHLVVTREYLDTLRLEMPGFVPCKFQDGKYEPSTDPDLDYVFHCDLSPQKSK